MSETGSTNEKVKISAITEEPFERSRHRWDDTNKTDIKGMIYEVVA
jgi:hypothetical protein